MHEFRNDEFRLGRVIFRKNSLIGGMSLIRCGVEVGEGATVALGAVVGKDIAPGTTVGGNPARLYKGNFKEDEAQQ
jgi:maltose O-acetyltransferase